MVEQETVWLTRDAFEKLSNELDHLKTHGRPEVAAKIAAAREEGDLSENGGYHAARDEQGQMEGRIAQLEQMLRTAQVGDAPADPNEVCVGTLVTIAYFDDEDDTETFLLGSREMLALDEEIETEPGEEEEVRRGLRSMKERERLDNRGQHVIIDEVSTK